MLGFLSRFLRFEFDVHVLPFGIASDGRLIPSTK